MAGVIDKLQRALDMGGNTHTLDDVWDAVQAGKAQLWTGDDAVIVTDIEQYPQCRVVRFWLAAGELDGVLAVSRRVYDWAKAHGCTKAVMVGRKGWTKALADEGWAPTLVHYARELE